MCVVCEVKRRRVTYCHGFSYYFIIKLDLFTEKAWTFISNIRWWSLVWMNFVPYQVFHLSANVSCEHDTLSFKFPLEFDELYCFCCELWRCITFLIKHTFKKLPGWGTTGGERCPNPVKVKCYLSICIKSQPLWLPTFFVYVHNLHIISLLKQDFWECGSRCVVSV